MSVDANDDDLGAHALGPTVGTELKATDDADDTSRTPGEVEFFDRIRAADLVATKAAQFARVSKFVMPFSEQLKHELRDAYPEDKDIYDKADALQNDAARTYLWLRALTFFSFLSFMCLVSALCYFRLPIGSEDNAWKDYRETLQNGWVLNLSIIGLAFIFYVIRRGLRGHFLYNVIKNQVSQLSYSLGQKQNELDRELAASSGRVETRQDSNLPNISWPDRAHGSIKILLWFAKRLEALDRFATTVMWKMDVFDERVELATWIAKFLVLAVAAGILVCDPAVHAVGGAWVIDIGAWQLDIVGWQLAIARPLDVAVLFAIITSSLAYWRIWIRSNRAETDYWKKILIREITPEGTSKPKSTGGHYFNIMANRVKNLVVQIMHAQRVSDKSGAGPGNKKDD